VLQTRAQVAPTALETRSASWWANNLASEPQSFPLKMRMLMTFALLVRWSHKTSEYGSYYYGKAQRIKREEKLFVTYLVFVEVVQNQ
jgi:hypothetical protein